MSVRVKNKKELEALRREANTLHVLLLAEILRNARHLLEGLEREHQFCKRKWRIDLSWPKLKIAVECDGGRYCMGGGKHNTNADYDKINELNHLGWKVLRFNSDQIRKNPMHCIKNIERALNEN
tara:strand:+ start:1718 stop:2089 length:372 start_codon:yes stop_codon:yes gene_type:complete